MASMVRQPSSILHHEDDRHFCKAILYDEIPDTSVRLWDMFIFVPNLVFLIYLLYRAQASRERIRQLNSFPILKSFHIFIYLCVVVSMARCLVSVVMKVHTPGGDLIDKMSWVVVRFFLLSTEISVLVFGLFSGHLDVRQSIRRILSITAFVSLIYSVCQGSLEIVAPDASFFINTKQYYLYGHGGMIFWFITCLLCALVYLTVVLLPWTPCRHRLLLPTKRSFYVYTGILSLLNGIQSIGTLMFYFDNIVGLCIVDLSTYFYFTCFTPLVYFTFISPFIAAGSSNSAAAAMVTSTAGGGGGGPGGVGGGGQGQLQTEDVSLTRPNSLLTSAASGLRGAVNFSYRPQLDSDLLDNEEEFAYNFAPGGATLNFDHYGPYAYNVPRQHQGHLFYGSGIPRDMSSYSIHAAAAEEPMLDNQQSIATKKVTDKGGEGEESSGPQIMMLEKNTQPHQQVFKHADDSSHPTTTTTTTTHLRDSQT